MFGNIGFGEIILMGVLGLLIFGPERLPKAVADAARLIRQLRAMAGTAVEELKSELPPDLANLDLRSMHPRAVLRDALSGAPALAPIEKIRSTDEQDAADDAASARDEPATRPDRPTT